MRYWDGDKAKRPKNYQRHQNTEKPGRKLKMTHFEEFFLTLVRLRLGLLRTHLSHIFGVNESQISKVFITWVTFLCHELKSLNIWPTKEQIQTKLPPEFKRLPNNRVVIDCTEVFIEKPTLSSAKNQLGVNTKNIIQLKLWWVLHPLEHSVLCLNFGQEASATGE